MMKKTTLMIGIAVLAFSIKTKAQVGINIPQPTSTLDITAKNETGTFKNVDGLLIPRVDRQRAQSMASVPTSTLIYINSITTGSQTGTTANVDATGYYYYNGTAWTKLNPSAPAITNIYNTDGTLTDNRIVTQGDKTLNFKANSVNAFSVNNALSVDAANNRVGIGTISPTSVLSVSTSVPGGITDALSVGINNCGLACGQNTARNITLFNANQTNTVFGGIEFIPSTSPTGLSGAAILGIDRDGANNYAGLAFFTRNANNYASRLNIKSSGKVGITTEEPATTLDITAQNPTGTSSNVDGLLIPRVDRQRAQSMTAVPTSTLVYINDVTTGTQTGIAANIDTAGYYYFNQNIWTKLNPPAPAVSNIYNANGTLTDNRTVTQGDKTLNFKASSVNAFSVNNALSVDAASNRVGIGTTTPNTRLDVITDKNSFGIQHTDGNIGLRTFVGIGDSNGKTDAAWFGTYSAHPLDFMTTNYFRMRIDANGKVGIGTPTPSGKLTVSGQGGSMLSLINTNVYGNPTLNIYPGYTSNGNGITEGNQYGVVFDQDPGGSGSGATQSLYDFHGQIRSVTSSTLSDARLKENIENLSEYGLSEVLKIQPRKYILKQYGTHDIGVIAQELKAIVPELVLGDETKGLLSVDYSKISLVLVNAIKEQQKQIKVQQEEIKDLQNEIKLLKDYVYGKEKK